MRVSGLSLTSCSVPSNVKASGGSLGLTTKLAYEQINDTVTYGIGLLYEPDSWRLDFF